MKCIFHWLLRVTGGVTIASMPLASSIDVTTYKYVLPTKGFSHPVIPASTIRGAWRTATCYSAWALGASCCGTKNPDESKCVHDFLKNNKHEVYYVNGAPLCTTCAIFGASGAESIVEFSDAKPIIDGISSYRLSVRPGVALSNYTRTVQEGKLYFREVIEPGSLFYFRMAAIKPPEQEKDRNKGWCRLLEVLLRASNYVEAVGIGRGAAVPILYALEEITESGATRILVRGSEISSDTICGCPELTDLVEGLLKVKEVGGEEV